MRKKADCRFLHVKWVDPDPCLHEDRLFHVEFCGYAEDGDGHLRCFYEKFRTADDAYDRIEELQKSTKITNNMT